MVPSVEHLAEIPVEAVVNCAGDDGAAVLQKRCKKGFVSDFMETWLVQCSQLQARRCGWSHLRSWQEAVRFAPEAFSEVHQDTPRRWHKQGAKTQPLTRGPKPLSTAAQLAILSQNCVKVSDWVNIGTDRTQIENSVRFLRERISAVTDATARSAIVEALDLLEPRLSEPSASSRSSFVAGMFA